MFCMEKEQKEETMKLYQKEYYEKHKKRIKKANVTLSVEEYKEFEKLALKEGLSVPEQIKRMAIAYKKKNYIVPKAHEEELQELILLLRNVGNNINQIAHRLHLQAKQTGEPPTKKEGEQILQGIYNGLGFIETTVKKAFTHPKEEITNDTEKSSKKKT